MAKKKVVATETKPALEKAPAVAVKKKLVKKPKKEKEKGKDKQEVTKKTSKGSKSVSSKKNKNKEKDTEKEKEKEKDPATIPLGNTPPEPVTKESILSLHWGDEDKMDETPKSTEPDSEPKVDSSDNLNIKFNIYQPIMWACVSAGFGALTNINDKKRIIRFGIIGAAIGTILGFQFEYKPLSTEKEKKYVNLIQFLWLKLFPKKDSIDLSGATSEIEAVIKYKLNQLKDELQEQDTPDQ